MFGLWGLIETRNVPIAFVFYPIVGWAGLRFGPRGSTTLVALMSAFAIVIAGRQLGPFCPVPVGVHAIRVVHVPRPCLAERIDARGDHGRARRRDEQAADARRAAASLAEDGGGGPPRRRHRARLQQPADGDHRLHRDRAARSRSQRRSPRRCGGDRPRRHARRRPDPPDARVQPPPGAAAEDHRPQQGVDQGRADAAPHDRRGHCHDRERPRRQRVCPRRSRPGRTGGDEPGGQRARCDAAGRPPQRRNRRRAARRSGGGGNARRAAG